MNLKHTEDLKLTGRVELIATHKTTGEQIIIKTKNLRVTIGKTWLLNFLVNKPNYDNGFTYCALGNDNTAVAVGQTCLVAEQKRKPITSKNPITSGVEITLSTFFTAAEATFYIKEGAIFGHDASATANSGTMWSRWLVTFDNSGGTYDITINYILTVN
jgi:hypothetical protein